MDVLARRCSPRLDQFAAVGGDTGCQLTQFRIEGHGKPPVISAVEQQCLGYMHAKDFFEAYRLSAELHLVRPVCLRLTALVLDRHGTVFAEFDNIADAENAECLRRHPQRTHGFDTVLIAGFMRIRALVQNAAFGREDILFPLAFDVYERALPRAIEEVL